MAQPQKEPLRSLTPAERTLLGQVAAARGERMERVERARLLLAVAEGASFAAAARSVGRKSAQGVAKLGHRFNTDGMSAVAGHHGGGPPRQYDAAARARILREFQRPPAREHDGTATWSLATLQRALRRAPDGLPQVSTFTILSVLHDAGYTYQRDRTWCHTGTAQRQRRDEHGNVQWVQVTDPRAVEKRAGSSRRMPRRKPGASPSGVKTRRDPTRLSPNRGYPGSCRASPPGTHTSMCVGERPSY